MDGLIAMVNGTIWGRREADERQFQAEDQKDRRMRIVYESPPLFDEISARFKLPPKGVIFAWGDIIYNPSRIDIPHQLIAHEAVHSRRQDGDPEGWWRRYLVDDVFRLDPDDDPVHPPLARIQRVPDRAAHRDHVAAIAEYGVDTSDPREGA